MFKALAVCYLSAVAVASGAAESPIVSTQSVYSCMCDASAAVSLNSKLFAVANDEDNSIRVYSATDGGSPIKSYELSRFLRVDPKKPETDLEGGCRVGDRIYWITSHGQNKEGEFRASRHAFFATAINTATGELSPAGHAYHSLLPDLLRDPRLAPFRLQAASFLPPKARGGLNIEGLCAMRNGQLLIGFRNPLPQGRALLVPLENPDEVVAGKSARFGAPILLNLDGLGVRDIALRGDQYLIVAGSYDGSGKNRLYRWFGGQSQPELIRQVDLGDINAEAIIIYPEAPKIIQILSDDGTRKINGIPCKKLEDPLRRAFRSVWVTLPEI